jgi:hypothetical protein
MMRKRSTRADDEALLDMLIARTSGVSSYEIGRMIGMTAEAVRIATNRVRAADLVESNEPSKQVLSGYWGTA